MALVRMNFESIYLNNNHEIGMILPDVKRDGPLTPKEFFESGKKYKVLWLLHGTYGDYSDWIRKSNIERYASERDLIVVMPSGLNANYANWDNAFGMGYQMYDYFLKELMPMVYNWFPASDKREDNYIAGLSMGGMGALLFGVNHPDKFAGVASLSAPAFNLHKLDPESGSFFNVKDRRFRAMVENAGGEEAYRNTVENVWDLLPKQAKKGVLPAIYCCCGTEDFLYPSYKEFEAYAKEEKLPITFVEEAGYKHEWAFWDRQIQKALKFFQL